MPAQAFGACETGSYKLADGGYVDIASTTGPDLRWRMLDGTTGALAKAPGDLWTSTMGWTGRADRKRASFDCARNAINFDGSPGKRIDFDVVETR
jgi:hypothetical protein